ncbi:MAG TPA: fasciclin domain-containing protein [Aliidiomarina sp.]|nr:fasciclin domain-containing protein [Aliidiomarina sp.]
MKKLTLISISIALATGFTASAAVATNQDNAVSLQQKTPQVQTASTQQHLGTIAEITENESSFATLFAALEATDLDELLGTEGPYTVFAPSDTAFEELPEGTMARLLDPANVEELKTLLSYHVIEGSVSTADLADLAVKTETLEGSVLEVKSTEYGLKVNDANVITADIQANNGVIHIIDKVLMPESMQEAKAVARVNK